MSRKLAISKSTKERCCCCGCGAAAAAASARPIITITTPTEPTIRCCSHQLHQQTTTLLLKPITVTTKKVDQLRASHDHVHLEPCVPAAAAVSPSAEARSYGGGGSIADAEKGCKNTECRGRSATTTVFAVNAFCDRDFFHYGSLLRAPRQVLDA
jgi:hypothetical protein